MIPCVHEFGIIDDFNIGKDYGYYVPKEYNCISVGDDLINDLSKHLKIMKSYFHSYSRPEYGLAYWGVTIIPPESLSLLYDVVVSSPNFKKSDELTKLAAKIIQSKEEKKYMIHFGI
ncbi:short-chain dehydrogenase [Chengkuizengella sp. SCS-71B]|uniref:short-chain dehydrogenase n=1 Tax=Chengkuizengella sp. SCS-71B TaxID=3115290 RepID=UPI0039B73F9C